MRSLIILASIFTFSMFMFGCGETKPVNSTSNGTTTNPSNQKPAAATPSPVELAGGASIYKEHCAKCHKEDGSGGKVDIDGVTLDADSFLDDKMKKMSDEKYYRYITKGIPDEGMPAFEDKLSQAQINDVVKYIRTEFQKQQNVSQK